MTFANYIPTERQYERLTKFHEYIFKKVRMIELDIVDSCEMKCRLCVRGCGLDSPFIIRRRLELSDIHKFIKESIETNIKWKIIKVVGGEPTLHPDIIKIINLLKNEYCNINKSVKIYFFSHNATKKAKEVNSSISSRVDKFVDYYNWKNKIYKKTIGIIDYPHHYSPYIVPSEVGKKSAIENGFCMIPNECGLGFSSLGYTVCCDMHNFIRLDKKKYSKINRLQDLMNADKFINQMLEYCHICGIPLKIYNNSISKSWAEFFKKKHNGIDLPKFKVIE